MNMNTGFISWMISFLGFPLGGLAATAVIGRLDSPLEGLVGGLIVGMVVGTAQMLALRSTLNPGWHWVLVTAGGFGAGVALSVALFGAATDLTTTLTRAPLTGLAIGLSQAWLLQKRVRAAWVWPLMMTAVYPLAWWVTAQVITTSLEDGFVVFGASGALVHQLATGVTLVMLKRPSA